MNMADQPPKDMIGFLDYYLVTKAPFQLPMAAKEAIVKYGPWIAIVLLLLGLPAILFVLGIGALFAPFAGAAYAASFTYTTIFLIIILGLEVAALPGLFARKMQGWRLIFYARLLAIASSLVSGLIINAIVGGLISLYILFQVRPLYEGHTEPATPAVQG
jgi:hypothetical protein